MSNADLPAGSHAERLLSLVPDRPLDGADALRVLVVAPTPVAHAELVAHLTASGTEVLGASSVAGTREVLATQPVSLILCDPAVAGDDQHAFLARLTEHASANGIPLIAFGGDGTALADSDLYALGAEAVLHKPLDTGALVALVRTRLRRIAQERSRMLQDPITALPNHAVFHDAYQRATHLANREREPLSLGLLHVDSLRDTRAASPTAADRLLRRVAETVRSTLRRSDLVARWTGDALLILFPNTDARGAREALEKIYHRLQRADLESAVQGATPVTLSAGVVEPQPQLDLQEALEQAVANLRPLVSAEELAMREPAAAPPPERPRILLAEDDALTASIVRHRLERAGFEVLHVSDGAKVLSLAPEAGLAMLILDVKMPYMDGFEALRRIRSIRALRNTPVVLLTSMGNEDDIVHGFELGADDYVVKPFSPVELLARVRRRLHERHLPGRALHPGERE